MGCVVLCCGLLVEGRYQPSRAGSEEGRPKVVSSWSTFCATGFIQPGEDFLGGFTASSWDADETEPECSGQEAVGTN